MQPLDEPLADTTGPAGKTILTVFGGIAEFGRSLVLARTEEGRNAAVARGVAFGRPAKRRDDRKGPVRELVRAGRSISSTGEDVRRPSRDGLPVHQGFPVLMTACRPVRPRGRSPATGLS